MGRLELVDAVTDTEVSIATSSLLLYMRCPGRDKCLRSAWAVKSLSNNDSVSTPLQICYPWSCSILFNLTMGDKSLVPARALRARPCQTAVLHVVSFSYFLIASHQDLHGSAGADAGKMVADSVGGLVVL